MKKAIIKTLATIGIMYIIAYLVYSFSVLQFVNPFGWAMNFVNWDPMKRATLLILSLAGFGLLLLENYFDGPTGVPKMNLPPPPPPRKRVNHITDQDRHDYEM